jgi:hypothetical protein
MKFHASLNFEIRRYQVNEIVMANWDNHSWMMLAHNYPGYFWSIMSAYSAYVSFELHLLIVYKCFYKILNKLDDMPYTITVNVKINNCGSSVFFYRAHINPRIGILISQTCIGYEAFRV